MALFVVIPRTTIAGQALDRRVRAHFDTSTSLHLDSGAWFITTTGTPRELATKLDILAKEGNYSAIVLALTGSYSGRAPSEVWDWLKVAVESGTND